MPHATRHTLYATLTAERQRFILWMPVALMLGIGIYFSLNNEPDKRLGPSLLVALLPMLGLARSKPRLRLALFLCLLPTLGFTLAQWRTQAFSQPLLTQKLRFAEIEGTITHILIGDDGAKLVLDELSIKGIEQPPKQIRIAFKSIDPTWQLGDRVRLKADLFPLPRPALPDAFDFARYLYFEGIGATGYAFKPPEIIAHAPAHLFRESLNALRHRIAENMRTRLPEPVGALAAAMSVGEESAISDETNDTMRAAGIYHVISISGLHMALAAGIVFFTLRLLLTLYPPLALRLPVKKIAAAGGLLSAFAYLLLAGSPIPAQRSFIMVAFIFVAIFIDRKGISVHALAWAATFILLLFPEAMLGASFHMSFAATLAIIAFYERFGYLVYKPDQSIVRRFWFAFLGIAFTSLVATLATAPFVIHHFNRLQTWGILANMAVVPLAYFVIMPGVVLSFLLMPFGLEAPGYWLLEHGIHWMMRCAEWVAAMPYATLPLPSLTPWGFLLAILGLLWLCLWSTRLRLLGIPMLLIGLSTFLLHIPPDIILDDELKQVAVRLDDGKYTLLKGSGRAFTVENWLRTQGQEELIKLKDTNIACDENACHYLRDGVHFTLAKNLESWPTLCHESPDILAIWYYMDEANCDVPILIDRHALEAEGVMAVYIKNSAITVRSGAAQYRPWIPE